MSRVAPLCVFKKFSGIFASFEKLFCLGVLVHSEKKQLSFGVPARFERNGFVLASLCILKETVVCASLRIFKETVVSVRPCAF